MSEQEKMDLEYAKMQIISGGSVRSIGGMATLYGTLTAAYKVIVKYGSENEKWAAKIWLKAHPNG